MEQLPIMSRPSPPNPLPPDQNIGSTLTIITSILTGFMLLTTGLRLYTRFSLHAQGWDDYSMIVVNILALARMSVQAAQVAVYNNGRHRWYISESNYINNNMLGWYAQILLFASVCFLKVSILCLIMRLRNEPRLKRILYVVIGGLFVTNFGTIIILVAECSPPSVYWTRTGGTCWNTRIRIYAIYFTIGISSQYVDKISKHRHWLLTISVLAIAYSIVTDILCSLLPIYVVRDVHMKSGTKAAVCGLMSLGLV